MGAHGEIIDPRLLHFLTWTTGAASVSKAWLGLDWKKGWTLGSGLPSTIEARRAPGPWLLGLELDEVGWGRTAKGSEVSGSDDIGRRRPLGTIAP